MHEVTTAPTPRALAKAQSREDRLMKRNLIESRMKSGLTQSDVAELLGMSQQAVSKFEQYDSDPRLSTILRYANAVGVIVRHSVHSAIDEELRHEDWSVQWSDEIIPVPLGDDVESDESLPSRVPIDVNRACRVREEIVWKKSTVIPA